VRTINRKLSVSTAFSLSAAARLRARSSDGQRALCDIDFPAPPPDPLADVLTIAHVKPIVPLFVPSILAYKLLK
jgi:hypothetical protein